MLFWILAALAVFLFNIYLPAILYLPTEGVMRHVGSRDEAPQANALTGRARRSLANLQENLPIFVTLGLLAMIVDGVNMDLAVWGAQVFVLARIAYIPAYMFSIPFTRSIAYTVGLIGCFMIAAALL